MFKLSIVFALTAFQAVAGGDEVEIWEYECTETEVFRSESKILIRQPAREDWRVCMLYRSQSNGPDPGTIVVTIRDTRLPDNSPHVLAATIIGFSPSSDSFQTESCIDLSIDRNEVLAAIQTAGIEAGRTVRACTLAAPQPRMDR